MGYRYFHKSIALITSFCVLGGTLYTPVLGMQEFEVEEDVIQADLDNSISDTTKEAVTIESARSGEIKEDDINSSANVNNPVINSNGSTTWDCIWYGNYWQEDTDCDTDADTSDEKQPIKWRVLSVDGDDAFVVSDKCLDSVPFNTKYKAASWEKSTIRSWLNGYDSTQNVMGLDYSGDNESFINEAFTDVEKSALIQAQVVNDSTQGGLTEGNNTTDNVFLLSYAEVINNEYGFDKDDATDSPTRFGKNTTFARTRGGKIANPETDENSDHNGNGWWWLRTMGSGSKYAMCVLSSGGAAGNYNAVNTNNYVVRPALHVSLSSLYVQYAGTVCSDGTVNEEHSTYKLITSARMVDVPPFNYIPIEFNYSLESCLEEPATAYNPELAHMLITLASAAYPIDPKLDDNNEVTEPKYKKYSYLGEDNGDDEGGVRRIEIVQSLINLGFETSKIEEHNYYQSPYDPDYKDDAVGYTFARKEDDNGSTIIVVVVRGSWGEFLKLDPNIDFSKMGAQPLWFLYSNDWKSNANFENSGVCYHRGFFTAAEEVQKSLKEYIGNIDCDKEKIKFVLTSHSRGSAVTNIIAKDLIDQGYAKEKVYDYNFACPDCRRDYTSEWNPSGKYDSIFNINNVQDPVGVMPGAIFSDAAIISKLFNHSFENPQYFSQYWGKYGKTMFYSTDWESADKTAVGDFSTHEPIHYINDLKELYEESYYQSWEEARLLHLALRTQDVVNGVINYLTRTKVVGMFCPVDVCIFDSKNQLIAETKNNEPKYYSNTAQVVILTEDDRKLVYLGEDDEYRIILKSYDSGKMDFYVSEEVYDKDTDSIDTEMVSFENVVLENANKTFAFEESNTAKLDDAKLYVIDEDDERIKEVDYDGNEISLEVDVKGISLSSTEITLYKEETTQIEYSVYPKAATNKSVKWNSSDIGVASVDEQGLVTAIGTGEAKIYATTENGGFTESCVVRVKEKKSSSSSSEKKSSSSSSEKKSSSSSSEKKSSSSSSEKKSSSSSSEKKSSSSSSEKKNSSSSVKTVKYVKTDNTFVGGQKIENFGRTYFKGVTGIKKYGIDNKKVVSVSNKGVLKAKKSGRAVIKALTGSGKDLSTVSSCEITVLEKPKLKFAAVYTNEDVGKELDGYMAFVTSSTRKTAADGWESSNPSVASVDSNTGVIKIQGTGKTKITAYFGNVKVKGTLKVK